MAELEGKTLNDMFYSNTVKIASLPDASQKAGTSRPQLHVDQMQDALKEVSSYPLLTVAISGEFRSGKSFLLNLMTTYLEHLNEGNPESWINSGVEIKGVQWAQSAKAVTRGIWMWKKPFVLTRSDGSKVAIILFDCQGTGDVQNSSLYLDTLITYISLQLSNVQIINLKNILKADDLTRLEMCTDYADAVSDDTDECDQHIFDRLIYLQRNWEADEDYGERKEAEFTDLIESGTTSQEVRKAGRGITKAFRHVSVYALPHPGKNVPKANEAEHVPSRPSSSSSKYDNLCVKEDDIDREFLEGAKEMFDKMFLDEAEDRHLPLASKALDEFELLRTRIAEADLSIGSPASSLHETLAYRAFVASRDFFAKAVEELLPMKDSTTKEVLQNMNDLRNSMEEHYKHGYKYDKFGDTEAYKRYWNILNTTWNDNRNTRLAMARHKEAVSQSNKRARLAEEYSRKVAFNERERLHEFVRDGSEMEERFAILWAEQEEMIKAKKDQISEEANSKIKGQEAKREHERKEEQQALEGQEESQETVGQAGRQADEKEREQLEEEEAAEARTLVRELTVKREAIDTVISKLIMDEQVKNKKELEQKKEKLDKELEEELCQLSEKEADAKQAREEAESCRQKAVAACDSENKKLESNMFVRGLKKVGSRADILAKGLGDLVAAPWTGFISFLKPQRNYNLKV